MGESGRVDDIADETAVSGAVDLRHARMMTASDPSDRQSPGKPVDLGLGWTRKHDTTAGPPHVEHLGAGGGYDNAMRIYPDLDLGLVVMANTTARYDHDALFDSVLTLTRLP